MYKICDTRELDVHGILSQDLMAWFSCNFKAKLFLLRKDSEVATFYPFCHILHLVLN